LVAILVLGARAIHVPLARLCQRSSRAVVVIVRPVIGGLAGALDAPVEPISEISAAELLAASA
jgi:hypothetical protein